MSELKIAIAQLAPVWLNKNQTIEKAEQAMRDVLAVKRPQDGIWGEEFGRSSGVSGLNWVLDPIDGTRGFISGAPTWGVLIALSDPSGPLLGIIDQPYIGERFVGGFGQAYYNGPLGKNALATRSAYRLDQATLFSTYPEVGTKVDYQGFRAVADRANLVRYGADCYAYALLAAGQIDLVIEAGLQPYDIQAPIALVKAAGGVVSDWRGGNPMNGGRCICAATPELHAAALDILREVPLG